MHPLPKGGQFDWRQIFLLIDKDVTYFDEKIFREWFKEQNLLSRNFLPTEIKIPSRVTE